MTNFRRKKGRSSGDPEETENANPEGLALSVVCFVRRERKIT